PALRRASAPIADIDRAARWRSTRRPRHLHKQAVPAQRLISQGPSAQTCSLRMPIRKNPCSEVSKTCTSNLRKHHADQTATRNRSNGPGLGGEKLNPLQGFLNL